MTVRGNHKNQNREPMGASHLPTSYRSFIHKSRYARWRDAEARRETWEETIARYFDFMGEHLSKKHDYTLTKELRAQLESAVLNCEIMPSMRSLMTAGPALARENVASFNCSYLPIDDPKCFDEAMMILLCFHPDTLVRCADGDKKISEIKPGDFVASFNEERKVFEYKEVTQSIKTPSSKKKKVLVSLDNGTQIKCTADHKWLTSNRGYVEAQNLTPNDDLVCPTHEIYKHTSTVTGKAYVGLTTKGTENRFKQHLNSANCEKVQAYNSHFLRAVRAHGKDAWESEILDFAYSSEEAIEKEKQWIEFEDSYRNGYNSTIGGEGALGFKWPDELKIWASENAYKRTEEHREAQRQRLLSYLPKIIEKRRTPEEREKSRLRNLGENNPCYGRVYTEEQKDVARKKVTGKDNPFFGKTHTDETKKKISDTKKGKNKGHLNSFFGKKHSKETREKMSAYWANRRSSNSNNSIQVTL